MNLRLYNSSGYKKGRGISTNLLSLKRSPVVLCGMSRKEGGRHVDTPASAYFSNSHVQRLKE